MDREQLVDILNKNLLKTSKLDDFIMIIVEYLKDKGFRDSDINDNIDFIIGNHLVLNKCIDHSIEYFMHKLEINTVQKENKTILYF